MSNEIVWDGVVNSYIPAKDWKSRIDTSVQLHTAAAKQVDPITYEVIRHALWVINQEHGMTVAKISGSPVVCFMHDLNPNIMTEDGEFVFLGPYVQFLNGASDSAVRWTLENLSKNPGIDDGDIFLTNDPWIGCCHQMDQVMFAPVFWEGKVFCWVADSVHFYDVGGTVPGSFCSNSPDVFWDPQPWPPVKIVEKGELRRDIEGLFLRKSRVPQIVALDLRGEIAGCSVARHRIQALLERYGPETVKAVMRKIIDDSEAVFLSRLRIIPDGYWHDEMFIEAAQPGDRHTYKAGVGITKRGNTLIFDGEGTDSQVGAINMTFTGWKGAILGALTTIFCWDQLFAIGGVLRHVEFRPTPGTLTCATHPAAVSTSVTYIAPLSCIVATLLGRMVYTNPELRSEVFATAGEPGMNSLTIYGIDQWGRPYGTLFADSMVGTLGAFSFKDGVSSGGHICDPLSIISNVEEHEYFFPILMLYRREETDSGGAGKFRGGLGGSICYVPHGTDVVYNNISTMGTACSLPPAAGLFGGYPSSNGSHRLLRDTDVLDWFSRGKIPNDIEELKGKEERLILRQVGVPQMPADVWECRWSGAGGYGDPLERDPALVSRDVKRFNVSVEEAKKVYGVVLDPETLDVDVEATRKERQTTLAERLQRGKVLKSGGTSGLAK